jgi:hypothetical protein
MNLGWEMMLIHVDLFALMKTQWYGCVSKRIVHQRYLAADSV